MLSRSASYAVRAVALLADDRRGDGPVTVGRIAEALRAPRNYLSKVLHVLATRGVVTSKRGPGGGFALALPADELSIARVVEPFEPLNGTALCVLGRGRCSDDAPCEAHDAWSPVAREVRRFLERTTAADLGRP